MTPPLEHNASSTLLYIVPFLSVVRQYFWFPNSSRVDDGFSAGVMVAAAALPTAGNVYMLAQHYGIAPARVSASILISTALSVVTVSAVISLVS